MSGKRIFKKVNLINWCGCRNRKYYKIEASKEVILSAGGLNSPQLLMLSGIGPKNHLTELEIPVIQSLPVGEKLYDHLTFLGKQFLGKKVMKTNQICRFELCGKRKYNSHNEGVLQRLQFS